MNQVKKFQDPLDDFLDRPIAYNPVWRRLVGSTVGALFFSQAWYWSKRHPETAGWFFKTQKEWEEETGLTRTEQDTARRHCRRAGVLEEDLRGVPATLYYRVDREKVYEKLGIQFAGTLQTEFVGIPQTRLRKSRKQVRRVYSNFNKVTEIPTETPPEINKEDDELERRTSIFATLYQNNITMLTPLLADSIRDLVIEFPDETWYEPAFKIAVEGNHRDLRYIRAVLKGWKEHHFGWKPEFRKNGNGNGKAAPIPEKKRAMPDFDSKGRAIPHD